MSLDFVVWKFNGGHGDPEFADRPRAEDSRHAILCDWKGRIFYFTERDEAGRPVSNWVGATIEDTQGVLVERKDFPQVMGATNEAAAWVEGRLRFLTHSHHWKTELVYTQYVYTCSRCGERMKTGGYRYCDARLETPAQVA